MDNFMYYWVPLLAVILIGLITMNSIDRRRQSRKASERELKDTHPNRSSPNSIHLSFARERSKLPNGGRRRRGNDDSTASGMDQSRGASVEDVGQEESKRG